jgi:hypothetical protein
MAATGSLRCRARSWAWPWALPGRPLRAALSLTPAARHLHRPIVISIAGRRTARACRFAGDPQARHPRACARARAHCDAGNPRGRGGTVETGCRAEVGEARMRCPVRCRIDIALHPR